MLCLPLACLVAQAESVDAPRDAQGRTPLMQVVLKCHRSGNADKALALIAGGADVNARDAAGNTPLMLISSIRYYNHEMRSSLAVIKALVEAGLMYMPSTGRHEFARVGRLPKGYGRCSGG